MLLRPILFAGAFLSLFLLVLVVNKQPRNRADGFLTAWLLIIGLDLLFFYDTNAVDPLAPMPLQIVGYYLPLLHAPIMFAYIHQLTMGPAIKPRTLLLHGLPFLLAVSGLLYYYFDPAIEVGFQKGFFWLEGQDPLYYRYFAGTPLAISGAGYAVAGLVRLWQYQRRLPQLHANPSLVSLDWLRYVAIVSVLFFCLIYLMIEFGQNSGFIKSENVFLLVGTLTAVHVFVLGYFGLRQQVLMPVLEQDIPPMTTLVGPTYNNSGLSEANAKALFERLFEHMSSQRPYLDAEISLPELAAQLGCTPNQLSQVINQQGGLNFFTFINTYRLEEVKLKMGDPSMNHFTILALAYDAGFGSKASFNKVFKEATGETPSAFRKKVHKKTS